MSIEAGKLRYVVELQRQVRTQDPATGLITTTWEKVKDLWAAVEPASVREFNRSAAMQSQQTGHIIIRYFDDVDASMRIVHTKRGRKFIYNIHGVLPDKDSGLEYITLSVSQGVNDGQ